MFEVMSTPCYISRHIKERDIIIIANYKTSPSPLIHSWPDFTLHIPCAREEERERGGKETGSEDGGGRRERGHGKMLAGEVACIRELRTETGRFEVNASFRAARIRCIFVCAASSMYDSPLEVELW